MMDEYLKNRLLTALLHGDTEHRKWLTEAICAIFDGRDAPPPRGDGVKKRLQVALQRAGIAIHTVIRGGHDRNSSLAMIHDHILDVLEETGADPELARTGQGDDD